MVFDAFDKCESALGVIVGVNVSWFVVIAQLILSVSPHTLPTEQRRPSRSKKRNCFFMFVLLLS